ncbi:MAG TPA: class I SAM-dependent methyltransferase [Polyangiaceae bacterium]
MARQNSYVPPPAEIRRAFADATSGDLVFFARQCLERGGFDHALALAEALEGRADGEPALALCEAVAWFLGGDRERARARVEVLSATRPTDLNALSVLGEMRARTGDADGARRAFLELAERYPDYPGAQGALASLFMPGPPYRDVLAQIQRALSPRTYLEIGVETGATLALATTADVAVGVDPEAELEVALPASARVIREESDVFFRKRGRATLFGARPVELVFIDGMHRFEFALRDFFNAESWSSESGTIVLHDCVPIVPASAARERKSRFWVGDTWKAALALARHRPELRIRTILTPPSGLVVVRGLDPSSTLLRDRYDAIVGELAERSYPFAPGEWPPELHPVTNDAEGLREALG